MSTGHQPPQRNRPGVNQSTSQDAYKRNETHDKSSEGHPQSSDAYERNLDSSLTRDQQTKTDEEE